MVTIFVFVLFSPSLRQLASSSFQNEGTPLSHTMLQSTTNRPAFSQMCPRPKHSKSPSDASSAGAQKKPWDDNLKTQKIERRLTPEALTEDKLKWEI
jgi:hypothetical protein